MDPREEIARRGGYGFLLVFFVLGAGIVASGFSLFGNYKKHFRDEVERQLSAVAKLKVDELVDWRNERLADAAVYFKNATFSGLVRRLFEKPENRENQSQLRTWLSHVQESYGYARVFLLDAQGVQRMSIPDTPGPVAAHLLAQAPEILRSERIAFMDFHRDAPDGPIHLSLLVPVLDGGSGDRAMGILVLKIDPWKYLYPYIGRWPTPSRTAETLIVRRDGNDVLFLNELRFQKNTALELRIPLGSTDVPAVRAALGQEGVVEGVDYRGALVLAVLRAVPDSPWFLVARMDVAEAFAPLKERAWVMIALVSSLLLGAGAGTGFVWRHQRARFYRERYHVAEAQRSASSRQAALLSAVPDIIMEVDDNRVYTWANDAGVQFFGEDVIGKEAAFYFEGEQDTYQTVKPLFDGYGGLIYVESWQRRKDGERRLLAWWCRVLKDENGRVTGALSSAHDITARELAAEALTESEKKYRALFETMSEGIVYEDHDGKIISANPAAERLLGLSLEQMQGRTSLDPNWKAIHEDGSPFPGKTHSLNVAAKTGKPATGEVMGIYNPKSGAYVWLSVNSTPEFLPGEKEPFRAYAVFRDITERMRAEEALVLQKRIGDVFLTMPGDEMYYEVLKIILEVMESPFGVFGYIDEDGGLKVPSMTRDIWDKCQVPQKTIAFPRETWGDSSWPRAVREKKPNYSNDISTKTPEGHVNLRRHISLPILYQGEVIGLFQVANKKLDYTEADIRVLESIAGYVAPILSSRIQRQRHENELREKNDELTRFTYAVSHDLKSPLVTIQTFLGYLEQDMRKPDAGEADKDLTYIRNAADKAARLLNELLELSRIGRKVNPPVEVPLQEIVKEALDLVAGRIVKSGVSVEVTKDPVLLYGDRARLVEVFLNLVDNAIKFMGREREPRVEIGVDEVGGETVLFVRDNGIGIKPEYQTKLFGLFEKLDPGTEGTGVGLALVKRIVEVHGGRIWLESEGPGKGATFRFTLEKTKRKSAF